MASRSDGFAVMDVSTSICEDPKFRRIQRDSPGRLAPAFMAYMATMAESWQAGRRVTIEDAWPAVLPFDEAVVEALKTARLLDAAGRISAKSWREWFDAAFQRRESARERWRRANANRSVGAAQLPRGSDADTGATVTYRSVPSESRDSAAAKPGGESRVRANGQRPDPISAVLDELPVAAAATRSRER